MSVWDIREDSAQLVIAGGVLEAWVIREEHSIFDPWRWSLGTAAGELEHGRTAHMVQGMSAAAEALAKVIATINADWAEVTHVLSAPQPVRTAEKSANIKP